MRKVNVGIDLGTTYSTFAIFENGKVEILKNSKDSVTTPSVLYLEDGQVLIGEDAKEYQRQGNTNTVAFYKSRMGDPSYFAFLDGKEYSAEDLSAIFLSQMKKDIEETNDVEIENAVITVPAYFNDKQREATLQAGKKAGLHVLKIINEPTSAIIAYGLNDGKDKTVMVYDLGGGTFDVTIAKIEDNRISILSTNGNHQLGGKDWDEAILEIAKEQIENQIWECVDDYIEDLTELQVKCEEIKKKLTACPFVSMNVSCNGKTCKITVRREDFEERTSGLLQETFDLVDLCFLEISQSTQSRFSWKDIDEVVLVGGSTRMPQIKERVKKEYHREPITKNINVDTIVASGAAMQVELCLHSKISLTVAKKDENGKVNIGCLTLMNSSIEDITAHGLGMISLDPNGKDFVNSIIIPKNSKVNKVFSRDYTFKGKELDVYCLQGENRNPLENDLLGYYVISGMEKGKEDKITVNYLYNANGIVEISALDSMGQKLSALKKPCSLSIEEILSLLRKQLEEAKKAMQRKVEIILLIDTSYSMGGTPLCEAKTQAKKFLSNFRKIKNISISFGTFNDFTNMELVNSSDFAKVNRVIDSVVTKGCTTATPIKDTYHRFSPDAKKFLVILTDGAWDRQSEELEYAALAKEDSITIFGIGIADADEKFLDEISSGKGIKVDLSDLSNAFKEVASSIASEVNQNSLM